MNPSTNPNSIPLNRAQVIARLEAEWPESLLSVIAERVKNDRRKVVILDDDPTGTQTVHDVPVITEWDVQTLLQEFQSDLPCFFVLTNSRSLPPQEAHSLAYEIGKNLRLASNHSTHPITVISRSDSTLRGHFPGEVDALALGMEASFDAYLVVPFFLEGGRYTIDDVHYLAENELLVPVGETQFAQDASFGFRSSNLRDWVQEKTKGRIQASEVASVSLGDLRAGGPEALTAQLMSLRDKRVCIVNAVSMRDLEVLVWAVLDAEARGKHFLFRTAASFVQTRIGQAAQLLLTPSQLDLNPGNGGLIIVGSYVPKTTAQLQALGALPQLERIEMDVNAMLDERRASEIARIVDAAIRSLMQGQDTLIFTSRELVWRNGTKGNLDIGRSVSDALVEIVRQIPVRPRYMLAKGGITSSDVATKGLNVKRAIVQGQILPGVPVWQLDDSSRYPGLMYIIFPGNVGNVDALKDIVLCLQSN